MLVSSIEIQCGNFVMFLGLLETQKSFLMFQKIFIIDCIQVLKLQYCSCRIAETSTAAEL